jgi:F-type H+-transporting ATPase subunit b
MIGLLGIVLGSEGGGFDPLDPHLWGNAFWTLIVFAVALPLLWKVVYGPITRALYDRDLRAENAIARAEEAKAAAEKARADTEQQLAAARAEAQKQIQQARERAERAAQELLDKARRDADADRQKALAEIDAERRRALGEIRDLAVEVSLSAASRLLQREMRGEDQRALVKSFVAKANEN